MGDKYFIWIKIFVLYAANPGFYPWLAYDPQAQPVGHLNTIDVTRTLPPNV